MKVVVVGGGAAGMMAAITAAKEKNEVTLIEKTSSLGNKIKITGKGRCNLTFDGDIDDFKKNIVKNYKFMYSSFTNFTNKDVVEFFKSCGVKTKVERGGRVFPISDKAEDVVKALAGMLKKEKVNILLNKSIKEVLISNNIFIGVKLTDGSIINCDKCIIATGGKSFHSTGSSGDGYEIAKKIGIDVTNIKPGLVPLRSKDELVKKLQGLSLKNISFKLVYKDTKKVIYEDFGELMFAHFGLTGPVVLSSSSVLNRIEDLEENLKKGNIAALIDLKPALSFETLDKRICRDFEKYTNKEFKNSLNDLLPQKLIPLIIQNSLIEPDKKVNQITKKERQNLVKCIKEMQVNISDLMPLEIAIITCGGINVKEINPKTMESKKIKGLYFAGEILDIDAYTGGYNLQIAFSTAVAAGKNSNY